MFENRQHELPPTRPSKHLEAVLLVAAFHIPLTLLFGLVLAKSMSWETVLDGPMFMYSGFLMDHFGMAPMRDFFTYNMVGTHVIFRWLYHFFGGTLLGMRLADTTLLAVTLALFALIMKPFGWRVAWAGAAIFGLLHLTMGRQCYLQRDFIALIPLQLAILAATAQVIKRPYLRWIITGLFVGVMATIKPHLIIGGLVLYGYALLDNAPSSSMHAKRAIRIASWHALGACIPILWMAVYLAYYGQLGVFADAMLHYFPLHSDISGAQKVFATGEKLPYTVVGFFGIAAWGSYYQMAFGAAAGFALFIATPTVPSHVRRHGMLLAALALSYLVYPCVAHRFYNYHYYPFLLLSTIWVAFALYKWNTATPTRVKVCAWGMAAYTVAGLFYIRYDTLQDPPTQASGGYYRTTRIARWLDARLKPGDTVQGIEWASCGIAHAMMETHAKPATHTIWGEVFFHHVSNPYVKRLRAEFVEQITQSKPRFVIRSKIEDDYVEGPDCDTSFPELDAFLDAGYFPALVTADFVIWESNASATATADRDAYKRNPQQDKIDANGITHKIDKLNR